MAADRNIEDHFAHAMQAFLRGKLRPGGADCPHPGLLSAHHEGKLDPDEAAIVEAHLGICVDCREQLVQLADLDAGPRPLEPESPPAFEPEPAHDLPRFETEAKLEPVVEAAAPSAPDPAPEPDDVAAVHEPIASAGPSNGARSIVHLDPDLLEPHLAPPERPTEDPPPVFLSDERVVDRRRSAIGPLLVTGVTILAIGAVYLSLPKLHDVNARTVLAYWLGQPEALEVSPAPALPEPSAPAKEAEPENVGAPVVAAEAAAIRVVPSTEPAAPAAPAEDPAATKVEPERPLAEEPPPPPKPAPLPAKPPPPAVVARPSEVASVKKPNPRPAIVANDEPDDPVPPPAEETSEPERAFTVVARSNDEVLWRIAGAMITRSGDRGQTWEPQGSASGALLAGSAPSGEVCWAAGKRGTVVRTTDGSRWEVLQAPTSDDLVQVTGWSARSATVKSSRGQRFSTTDGGATWSKL